MPSGAKKRKAAKKKEKVANSNNLYGEDNSKVHEEKESDGGETYSPLSRDNHNNMHFIEGENKREVDKSLVQSAKIKSESIRANENGEIKLKDDSLPKDVTIENIEIEDVSSSNSSSSDEESKFVGKKIEMINLEKPVEFAPNLPVDLEKTSYLQEVTQVNEVSLHNLEVIPPNEESRQVVPIVEISNLVPQVEPVIFSKDEVHLDEDLGMKVNGKSEIFEVQSSVINILSTQETEDGEVTKIATFVEDESKTLHQSSIQVVDEKVNGAEFKKESEIESMDRQVPVALPPRPLQATPSMGCCGLFELFMGSNR